MLKNYRHIDHPVRRICDLRIVDGISKAGTRHQGEGWAVGDARVVDGSPLAKEQIPWGEQNGRDGLDGYGEASSWDGISVANIG